MRLGDITSQILKEQCLLEISNSPKRDEAPSLWNRFMAASAKTHEEETFVGGKSTAESVAAADSPSGYMAFIAKKKRILLAVGKKCAQVIVGENKTAKKSVGAEKVSDAEMRAIALSEAHLINEKVNAISVPNACGGIANAPFQSKSMVGPVSGDKPTRDDASMKKKTPTPTIGSCKTPARVHGMVANAQKETATLTHEALPPLRRLCEDKWAPLLQNSQCLMRGTMITGTRRKPIVAGQVPLSMGKRARRSLRRSQQHGKVRPPPSPSTTSPPDFKQDPIYGNTSDEHKTLDQIFETRGNKSDEPIPLAKLLGVPFFWRSPEDGSVVLKTIVPVYIDLWDALKYKGKSLNSVYSWDGPLPQGDWYLSNKDHERLLKLQPLNVRHREQGNQPPMSARADPCLSRVDRNKLQHALNGNTTTFPRIETRSSENKLDKRATEIDSFALASEGCMEHEIHTNNMRVELWKKLCHGEDADSRIAYAITPKPSSLATTTSCIYKNCLSTRSYEPKMNLSLIHI